MTSSKNTQPNSAVGESKKSPARKKGQEPDTPAALRPDMDTLANTETIAEAIDLMAHRDSAGVVPDSELQRFEARAEPIRTAMADAVRQEGKSRRAHARCMGLALPVIRALYKQPDVLWAIVDKNGQTLTERTLKSACLPAVKALYPDLDRREQSALAQLHNHAMACGWTGDELEREVNSVGVAAIIKRERQRQRLRAGKNETPSAEDAIERYRSEQPSFPMSQVSQLKESLKGGLGLAIFEIVDGEIRLFDIDDDQKRILSTIKHCTTRGCLLRTKPAPITVPLAAE